MFGGGGDVEDDADRGDDGDGVCRDHKAPTEDQLDKAFPNPASTMASLYHSNATS